MSSKIFTILIFLIIISGNSYAQNALQVQYNHAVLLYESGEYFDAITEFKRLIFFDHDKKYTYKSNMYIGECYKMGAKFSDAILFYTYSEIDAETKQELFAAEIKIIRANILRRTTTHALSLLDSLSADGRFSNKKNEINYWKGWAYIFSDEWGKAADSFGKIDSNKVLVSICNKVNKDKYSVTLADVLSHIIPGAGQFYTGHYLSGILSLGWNFLWGYVSINAFAANRVFDGIMVSNFLWFRFYRGNFENAQKFAERENYIITNQALENLQYNYNGLKP